MRLWRTSRRLPACGGQAFIAFKSNATGEVGGVFEKAFQYFQFKHDEYMQHYHKRSNVESTFSAVKRKFGDSVMSKTDTAMVNEVLCKLLCHNLSCLIRSKKRWASRRSSGTMNKRNRGTCCRLLPRRRLQKFKRP